MVLSSNTDGIHLSITLFLMKYVVSFCIVLLTAISTYAHHTLRLSIKSLEGKAPLSGATIKITSLNKTAVAGSLGLATFADITAGTYNIKISFVGLEEQEISITLPQPTNEPFEILG